MANFEEGWPIELYTAHFLRRRIDGSRRNRRPAKPMAKTTKQTKGGNRRIQSDETFEEGHLEDDDIQVIDRPTTISRCPPRPVSSMSMYIGLILTGIFSQSRLLTRDGDPLPRLAAVLRIRRYLLLRMWPGKARIATMKSSTNLYRQLSPWFRRWFTNFWRRYRLH